MSLKNNIFKIFGFGGDDDMSEYESSDPIENQIDAEPRYALPQVTSDGQIDISSETVDIIFQKVVEVFNQSLPGFIGQSVNADLQRKYLFNQLDTSIKEYLVSLESAVHAKCESDWEKERAKLQEETEALRNKAKDLEERRSSLKDKQLSADRQKRALVERVRDLENQVMNLEAEKEQYELENKAMANKAKAAAVLEEELQSIRGNADTSSNEAMTKLEQENNELKAELKKMLDAFETVKVKEEMNDAMAGDFKKRAAEANKSNMEMQELIAELEKEIDVKDSQIADLQKQLEEKERLINSEAATMAELEEIQNQLTLFEDVKGKMEGQIERLKTKLKEVQDENSSLKNTIKDNLMAQAEQEKELREIINELTLEIKKLQASRKQSVEFDVVEPAEPNNENKKSEKKGKSKSKKSYTDDDDNVDELMLGTDWLVSTPPENTSMRTEDSDFGYQTPPTKPNLPHNDAQMSLFDL